MTTHTLRLSVVLCTYNGLPYLPAQLDSLLSQSLLPDEIIVADDASADGSVDVLRAFVVQCQAIGIEAKLQCNSANVGYVANFSAALQLATGDVLFLCDQDDVWRQDKLALMCERFAADPALLLLHSDARLVDARGDSLHCSLFDALQMTAGEKHAIHAGRAFDVVMRRSFVTGATAALRREVLAMALPVAQGWIHDEWIAAVSAAIGRVDFIDMPLIHYRQHGGNQIGMRKRTLQTKWRELARPCAKALVTEVERLRRLEDFLAPAAFISDDRVAQVRRKRSHFECRIAIGRMRRYQRIVPILREARAGDYRRYGTGVRSVLRDLLRHD